MTSVHRETIELLLAAVHNQVGDDGMIQTFLFGKPGSSVHERRLGTTIFVSLKRITRAALHVRRHGPPYLRALSIMDIRSLLTTFLQENYYDIADDTFLQRFEESFAERVTDKTKHSLAAALARSVIFTPVSHASLFPLVPIQVESCFSAAAFFFRNPETLLKEFPADLHQVLDPSTFPPLRGTDHRKHIPASWLGIRAPVVQAAEKTKAAVLGALALTVIPSYRHMFSGRTMFGGVCTVNGEIATRFSEPHTPPMMETVFVRDCDQPWLSILATKVESQEQQDQRHLRALEYFYRAWGQTPAERFPLHFMALEAIYSVRNKTTKSTVSGVRDTLGHQIDEQRLLKLFDVRGAVIHGHAPDVYDATEYEEYYNTYAADPVDDLALVTAASLRVRVFGDTMRDQEDPHQAIVDAARAKGAIPKSWGGKTILDAPPTDLDASQGRDSGDA